MDPSKHLMEDKVGKIHRNGIQGKYCGQGTIVDLVNMVLIGFDRNWIIRPETGTETEFRLTGTGMAFTNSGSG